MTVNKCVCGKESGELVVVMYDNKNNPTIVHFSEECAKQACVQMQTLLRAKMSGVILDEPIGMKVKITKAGSTGGLDEVGIVTAKVKTSDGICAYIITPGTPQGYLKLLANVQEV